MKKIRIDHKRLALGGLGLFLLAYVVISMINIKPEPTKEVDMELKQELFVVAYGTSYSLYARDYIEADAEVLAKIKIEVENPHLQSCPKGAQCDAVAITDVYPVGEYKAKAIYKDPDFIYKDKILSFIIEIRDTGTEYGNE